MLLLEFETLPLISLIFAISLASFIPLIKFPLLWIRILPIWLEINLILKYTYFDVVIYLFNWEAKELFASIS